MLQTEADLSSVPRGFRSLPLTSAEWIGGASPDEPGFLLRPARHSGGSVATFAFDLTGVSHRIAPDGCTVNAEALDEWRGRDFLSLLMANMDEGDRLEVAYIGDPDARGGRCFSLQILQTLRAPGAGQAAEKVRLRQQELTSLLSYLTQDYSFTPAPAARVRAALTRGVWRARFRPWGLLLELSARQRIGFAQSGDAGRCPFEPLRQTASLALPVHCLEGGPPDYNGLARFVADSAAAIKISLLFEPFHLTAEDARLLADAADAVEDGTARLLLPGAGTPEISLDTEARGRLHAHLAQWAAEPAGYRLSCCVSASAPPSASLLEYLRRKLFRCNNAADARPAARGQIRLDLRGAFHRNAPAPSPFPSRHLLGDVGVRRFFTDVPDGLARSGILLGHAGRPGCRREVRFAHEDRACHTYVVGATGSGKSTLLLNMIAQDMQNGAGVAVIDPHGDLYLDVLASVPPHRVDDVVLVDCCDYDRAVGLNFLECRGAHRHRQMNFVSNEVIRIFDQLYDLEKTGGPLFEQYMRNALLLVMDDEERPATLLDIPLLFEDADYRRALVNGCRNPIVAGFWSKQAERAGGDMALHNMAPYVTSKLNQFTSNALLRPMIGQPHSTFDFRELMDRQAILLVNLAKGSLGELDTRLLGMLVMGKLFCAALGRMDVPPARRPPFYLYVDEFQNFTTETVANLLSEARKYGLHLTLANQNLAQLSASLGKQSVLDAVIGNCGNLFLFRQGAIDAQQLQAYTMPYLRAQDLQELPSYHIVARLLARRRPLRPFVFQALSPLNTNQLTTDLIALTNTSKRKYTRPTSEVERSIFERRRGSTHV